MFDNEQLKILSARAVSDYITKGVALTDAVAALSRDNSLNTEQTKRLVEATNQVAYLKILETAKDRTFNFPVAVYDDVLSKMVTPEGALNKQASDVSTKRNPLSIAMGRQDMEKAASAIDATPTAADYIEKTAAEDLVPHLTPVIFSYRKELEKLAFDIPNATERMLPLVDQLSRDPLLDAKLTKSACVHSRELCALFGIEMEKAASVGGGYLFKEYDLKKIAQLDDLIGEYQAMEARKQFLTDELEKVSFMAISGRIAGSIFGKEATGTVGTRRAGELFAGDVKATAPSTAKAKVVRGYQGYPGAMSKQAAAPSGNGLPPPGPSPAPVNQGVKPSFSENVAKKWNTGLISKVIPKGLTLTERAGRLATGADYLYMRESIAPKHSVWDALHNTGEAQQ